MGIAPVRKREPGERHSSSPVALLTMLTVSVLGDTNAVKALPSNNEWSKVVMGG